jgi:NADH-quinone oxidoreductase subunit F
MNNNSRFYERLNEAEKLRYCEQCGACSSACPITDINDFNIRRLLRFVELDFVEDIAGSPMPWFCATCWRCEEACPNGVKISDIVRYLRAAGPVHMIPDAPQCVKACPAGINIPGYLRLIADNRPDEAYALIMEKAPFPGVLGRVCPHPCEIACKRGQVNEPVAICAAKRYAADKTEKIPATVFNVAEQTNHKIAIIGSGPAGLSAAFFLRKKGHSITIFEARPKPGGMMRYGIPDFRLPENVLGKEIDQIINMGIELKTGRKFGSESDIKSLSDDGFEAVFIAVGAQLCKKIPLQGAELSEALLGLDFLVNINEGNTPEVKKNLIVIGGGNVAVDVALSALRLGAEHVSMVCLESREEVPADPKDIEMAMEHGVDIIYSWGPHKIIHENKKVSAAEFVKCISVFDENGNFCPCFEHTKKIIKADQVILAIGQAVDTDFCNNFSFLNYKGTPGVENGLLDIDHKTQKTSVPGVFAGGDAANGPARMIDAIAAGRRAANSIDIYLHGNGISGSDISDRPDYDGKRETGFADQKREISPMLDLSQRNKSFSEVNLCFDNEQAIKETGRCLQCDLEQRLVVG